jgi:hypothetical protein
MMLWSRDQMAELLKSGTSISHQRQSEVDTRTTLSTSKAMEDQTTLLWQALTLTGGSFSSLMVSTLSILRTKRLLMLKEDKIKKVKQFGHGEDITVWTRDGLFYTLLTERLTKRREWTRISEWKSTDHSSCNPECQWKES